MLVYVLGAVKNPNVYFLTPGQRVTEMLAEAGGLLTSVTDCRGTLLQAASRQSIPIDLRAALAGDSKANLPIAPGDVLTIVPTITISVYVSGAVKNPGLIALPENADVSMAIAVAGGLLLTPEEVRPCIMRSNTRIPVPPDSLLTLQSGDELRVDSRLIPIFVDGQVKTPNQYLLSEGSGV